MKVRRASVIAVALLVFAALVPGAHAKPGGKKPVGEIASFDGTTLTVTLKDGSSAALPVSEDLQVKVEHRGDHGRGRGHGNPSNGTTEDLVAGALVLRMKVEEGVLTKIRIRRAPVTTAPETVPAEGGEDSGEVTDPAGEQEETGGTDAPAEEPVSEEVPV